MKKGNVFGLLFLGLSSGLLVLLSMKGKKSSQKGLPSQIPSWQTIKNLASKYGFSERVAAYAVAVSAFETGGYTSSLFKRANNAFGMRIPTKRKSLRTGEDNNYSVYRSVGDSFEDFFIYLDALGYNTDYPTLFSFVSAMKAKRYFEADLQAYYRGCSVYFDKYFN